VALSQIQRAIVEKARSLGGGQQAVALTDEACTYHVAVIVNDLELVTAFPEFNELPDHFFAAPSSLGLAGDFLQLFERLVRLAPDADTYFACLAALHKSRLKYERILQTQPIPTIDQVGPRGLLQYGGMSPKALTGFLLWRKWLYDIDNRAAQETGYLFEPIIAASIGGVPASSSKSPIRRRSDPGKGRQVDCIRGQFAYEIKLRVTIAASGQGRWREELEFPGDCRASGYTPVLLVLDPTPNPKLDELTRSFVRDDGKVFVGAEAWAHLETTAGGTMGRFLRKYVHEPIEALLAEVPEELPELCLRLDASQFTVTIGTEAFSVARTGAPPVAEDDPGAENDGGRDDQVPGP
jgi:hypothetical protein